MRQRLAITAAVVQGLLTSVFALVSLGVAGFDVAAPPAAVDFSPSGLRHTSPGAYAVPFLAHAVATLLGAHVAAELAPRRRRLGASIVGVTLLAGAASCVPGSRAPGWFHVVDLTLAYLPFAALGALWSARRRR